MVTLTPPLLDVSRCSLGIYQCIQKCLPLDTKIDLGPVGVCCTKPTISQAQVPFCCENRSRGVQPFNVWGTLLHSLGTIEPTIQKGLLLQAQPWQMRGGSLFIS